MGWFRSNRCRVAWLAIFALACQFVLAFGHVHLGKVGGGSDAWAVAAAAGNGSADVPSSPPHKNPAGLVDDFCAICASISLASTLVIPPSPTVVPPISFVQDLPWSLAAIEPASFDHLLFNARGPPHA
jgi:hypothetical protein